MSGYVGMGGLDIVSHQSALFSAQKLSIRNEPDGAQEALAGRGNVVLHYDIPNKLPVYET